MIIYKFTNKDNYTRRDKTGETLWIPGNKVILDTDLPPVLCTPGVLHAYESQELAEFMDCIHGNFGNTGILWKAETDAIVANDRTKLGCASITLLEKVERNRPTIVNHVAFGIYSALTIYKNKEFEVWANNWLDNKDRSLGAAMAAAWAAWAAWAVARVARVAAWTAEAAAKAAAWAAMAAERAAAERAAMAAERAAAWMAAAWAAHSKVNLNELAIKAMKVT